MPSVMYNTVMGPSLLPFSHGKYRSGFCGYDYNPSEFKRVLKPRVDILEDGSNLYFEFDLPGLKRDDIKLTVNNDGVLTIEGVKKIMESQDNQKNLRSERIFGEFARSFELPDDVDTDKISAKFENGVLTLTLPKFEVRKKEVEIK